MEDIEPMKSKVIVKTDLAGDLKYIICGDRYYSAAEVEVIEQLPVKPKLINPVSSPRYDDVYEAGLKWLNEG